MKRLLSMFVIAICALCFSLIGCGGSSSNDSSSYEAAFIGTWNAVEVTGETSYTKDQMDLFRSMGLIDMFINFDEGGKAVMCSTTNGKSEAAEGTWTADSATQATLTINGNSTPVTLKDGVLSLSSKGSDLLFEKTEHRDPPVIAAASDTSASPSAESSASDASEGDAPEPSESASAQDASSTASASAQSQDSASSDAASGADYDVSIDAVEVGADYEGNPALLVTFTWKNNTDKTTSYASSLHAKCFQNGVQLDTAFVFEGIDNDGYMAEVRPGYGTTFQMAYKLKDTENPVEIEVGELFNYKGELLASKTFEL